MPSFPTERARLKVRNPAGDVKVETRDVAETTVELVPLNDSEATRQAIEKANVGARGDEVFVELEGRSWSISIGSWGLGSAKVSIRIVCPDGSDLECDTASADVRVIGTLGDARLRTASGDFAARPCPGCARGEDRQRRRPGRARRGAREHEHRLRRRRPSHRHERARRQLRLRRRHRGRGLRRRRRRHGLGRPDGARRRPGGGRAEGRVGRRRRRRCAAASASGSTSAR